MNELILTVESESELGLGIEAESELSLGVERSVGITNYDALTNKPLIEDVPLVGNKTFKQLGLEAMTPQEIDQMIYG